MIFVSLLPFIFSHAFAVEKLPVKSADHLIVATLRDVDLRGERETKFYRREIVIFPLVCKSTLPIKAYSGARQFIDRNSISAFGGPGSLKRGELITDSLPPCIPAFYRPDAVVSRHLGSEFKRGVDHPLETELYRYRYDISRPHTLLIWVDEQSHSLAYMLLEMAFKKGLSDEDLVTGYTWVEDSLIEPFVTIHSLSNSLQSVSLKFRSLD